MHQNLPGCWNITSAIYFQWLRKICIYGFFLLFEAFFGSSRPFQFFFAGTQGLVLAKQALYHLSNSTSPFCVGYL
jgi:hypothetical protein